MHFTRQPGNRRERGSREASQEGRSSLPMFPRAVAPDISMSPRRFPLEQWLSREAGLISMARNARGNMGRLLRPSWDASLLPRSRRFPGWRVKCSEGMDQNRKSGQNGNVPLVLSLNKSYNLIYKNTGREGVKPK